MYNNYKKIASCEYLITQWKISANISYLESGVQATFVSLLSVNINKKA